MKTTMSHRQAAQKIKEWYLSQYRFYEVSIKGTEAFTVFDKMKADNQDRIRDLLHLNPSEKPVLIFTICEGQYIINTSERFINITPDKQESIYYEDFDDFVNYESLRYVKKKKRKTDDPVTYTELGFKTKSGEIFFWKIPSENTGFLFWIVTRLIKGIQTKND